MARKSRRTVEISQANDGNKQETSPSAMKISARIHWEISKRGFRKSVVVIHDDVGKSWRHRGSPAGATRGSRGFFAYSLADESRRECASGRRTGRTVKRQWQRNTFHIASPAVELTCAGSFEEYIVVGSGGEYSHWPWSLQMRALSRPWTRSLLMVER
jgi:hypothetical protein